MDRLYNATRRIVKTNCRRRVEGNNQRGKPRLKYIRQIIKDQGCDSYVEIKKKADNRK